MSSNASEEREETDKDLDQLRRRILAFRDDRDWQQFHDPKNLADAIAIEAAELLELFLWSDAEASAELAEAKRDRIEEEAADIFIFLTYLCDVAGVELLEAVRRKLIANESRYPADKARGRSDKYKEL